MAISWAAKAPTAVREYTWTPDPAKAINTATPVVTTGTATIASEITGADIILTVTGGTAGVTQVFTVTASDGQETFVETFYLPIEASTNRLGNTARDVCIFALRKVTGVNREPSAAMLSDALERMNDFLAFAKVKGADFGLPLPVLEATELLFDDSYLSALKFNLRNAVHEFYGVPLTAQNIMEARSGLSAVMNSHIPRREVEYF